MKLDTIYNAVRTNFDCQIVKNVEFNPDISEIQLLNQADDRQPENDIIYTDLQGSLNHFSKSILSYNENMYPKINSGIIAKQDDLIAIQNFISNLLSTENKQSLAITNLSLQAMKRTPLQDIINQASKILSNPIIVIDNSYKVITYSTKYDISDPLWERIIEDGYAPYSLLLEMNRIVSNSNPDDALSPFYVSCDLSPVHKLGIRLTWENYNIGYIVMFNVPTPINATHWALLPKIAEITTETLSQSPNFGEMYGNSRQRILDCILDQNTSERIKILLSEAKITLSKNCIAAIIKPQRQGTNQELRYFSEELKAFNVNAFISIRDQYIYAIFPNQATDSFMHQLRSLAKKLNLNIMSSDVYSNFFESLNHLNYCKAAFKIGSKLHQLSEINQSSSFRFEIILSQLNDDDLLKMTESPILKVLKKHDQQHDSELLKTLEVYLQRNRLLKETAATLYIHRNTLTNRLEKITTLTNLDLSNSEQLFQVEYSFKILKFLHAK
ncbi:PucR family transcriptional regulator [Secundilactobacillus hailunensis]|uniref:PucR family transcriptional regulator n=1 Tax=Secundilactobacillus hailunensis TaxID=2559923 RepID=A0ABW1T8T1_9LACO|nr:helix-turn-helix domain-containing protein [Secundilactobacillus hailunensis]